MDVNERYTLKALHTVLITLANNRYWNAKENSKKSHFVMQIKRSKLSAKNELSPVNIGFGR